MNSVSNKSALITGILGQDGSFLTKLLLSKGYTLYGIALSSSVESDFFGWDALGIDRSQVELITLDHIPTIAKEGIEVYNLAAQSSVGRSWEDPTGTYNSNFGFYVDLLDRLRGKNARILQASSSEIFGNVSAPIDEQTEADPQNPYALSKFAAHRHGQLLREKEDYFITNALLFNHESFLRGPQFVTQKIIQGAREISEGRQEFLELGNIEVCRDWGLAEEYVEVMWQLLQLDKPMDIVVATGNSMRLREFIKIVFSHFGIDDYEKFIRINPEFIRKNEILKMEASITKLNKLGIHLSPISEDNISKLIMS